MCTETGPRRRGCRAVRCRSATSRSRPQCRSCASRRSTTPPPSWSSVTPARVVAMAELVADSDRAAGWTLLVDGVEQSYVDASDPAYLKFYYVRWIAAVLDAAAPTGEPLRVLHLGGGAMTLPRYVALRRPGSAQVVVEHDAALVALVDQALPRPTEIVVLVEDARAAVS